MAYTLTGLQRRTLGTMLGYALDHHAWDSAEGIVRALEEYWETRGLVAEAAAWADRIFNATATPGHAPPEASRSLWLYTTIRQAVRRTNAGQLDEAEQACRRALVYLQSQTTTKSVQGNTAVFYRQLGQITQKRGRLIEAAEWYRRSLAIEEELGNRLGMASIHHELGRIEQDSGQLSEAERWYGRSLALSEELSDGTCGARKYDLGVP